MEEHAPEEPAADSFEGHRKDELVQHSRNEKRAEQRVLLRDVAVLDHVNVQMSQAKLMHRLVPVCPEALQRCGVVPLVVERSVGVHGELCHDVQVAVEQCVKHQQPQHHAGD